jgi:hypothetical protein
VPIAKEANMETNRRKLVEDIKTTLDGQADFIFISYSHDAGVNIYTSIGDHAFTMLGALELSKMQLLSSFRDAAEKLQQKTP